MTWFKHILVPTDFGESAERALDYAIALAMKSDSKLTIVHASFLSPSSYTAHSEGIYWPTDDLMKAGKEALEETLANAKKRYPRAEAVNTSAEPCQSILETAKECGADLIIMGTHGRRGISRLLLGSVAEKIVRLSPIPVMTISGKAEQEAKEKSLAREGCSP